MNNLFYKKPYFLLNTLLFVLIACGRSIASDPPATDTTDQPPTIVNPGVALTVSTDKPDYRPGEPVCLIIRLKNFTSYPIPYAYKNWSNPDRLLVARIGSGLPGTDVPMTAYALRRQDLENYGYIGGMGVPINPGKQEQECFFLNRVRDLSESGTYEITLHDKEFLPGPKGGLFPLTSNTYLFTITEGERLPAGFVIHDATKPATP